MLGLIEWTLYWATHFKDHVRFLLYPVWPCVAYVGTLLYLLLLTEYLADHFFTLYTWGKKHDFCNVFELFLCKDKGSQIGPPKTKLQKLLWAQRETLCPMQAHQNKPRRFFQTTQSGLNQENAMHPNWHNIGPRSTEHKFDLDLAQPRAWQTYTQILCFCFFFWVLCWIPRTIWNIPHWHWTIYATMLMWGERLWSPCSGNVMSMWIYLEPSLVLCRVHVRAIILGRSWADLWQLGRFYNLFKTVKKTLGSRAKMPPIQAKACIL